MRARAAARVAAAGGSAGGVVGGGRGVAGAELVGLGETGAGGLDVDAGALGGGVAAAVVDEVGAVRWLGLAARAGRLVAPLRGAAAGELFAAAGGVGGADL